MSWTWAVRIPTAASASPEAESPGTARLDAPMDADIPRAVGKQDYLDPKAPAPELKEHTRGGLCRAPGLLPHSVEWEWICGAGSGAIHSVASSGRRTWTREDSTTVGGARGGITEAVASRRRSPSGPAVGLARRCPSRASEGRTREHKFLEGMEECPRRSSWSGAGCLPGVPRGADMPESVRTYQDHRVESNNM